MPTGRGRWRGQAFRRRAVFGRSVEDVTPTQEIRDELLGLRGIDIEAQAGTVEALHRCAPRPFATLSVPQVGVEKELTAVARLQLRRQRPSALQVDQLYPR